VKEFIPSGFLNRISTGDFSNGMAAQKVYDLPKLPSTISAAWHPFGSRIFFSGKNSDGSTNDTCIPVLMALIMERKLPWGNVQPTTLPFLA